MGVAINQYNRFISEVRFRNVRRAGDRQTNKQNGGARFAAKRLQMALAWPRFDPSPVIHGSYYFLCVFINCANK